VVLDAALAAAKAPSRGECVRERLVGEAATVALALALARWPNVGLPAGLRRDGGGLAVREKRGWRRAEQRHASSLE
jgi:hypothetical protein